MIRTRALSQLILGLGKTAIRLGGTSQSLSDGRGRLSHSLHFLGGRPHALRKLRDVPPQFSAVTKHEATVNLEKLK